MRSCPHPARGRRALFPASAPPARCSAAARTPAASRGSAFRKGALRRRARAVPLPRGAGSRGPRSRPPLAWPGPEAAPHGLGLARGAGTGARSDMGKKHKKHKSDKHLYEGEGRAAAGGGGRRLHAGPASPSDLPGAWRAPTRGGGAARRSRADPGRAAFEQDPGTGGCGGRPPGRPRVSDSRAFAPGSPAPRAPGLGQPPVTRRPCVSDYVEKPLKLVLKVGGNEVT
jgi:hypothetical protein